MFVVTQGYGGDGADVVLQGYIAGAPAPTPEPTPAPVSTVRAGAGQNILEMGWYDDKPWIRHRDRLLAKEMHDLVTGDEEERRRRRRRAEAIAVALVMLTR